MAIPMAALHGSTRAPNTRGPRSEMAGAPVLSVFFEGTANPLRPVTTQVGLFFSSTCALDVTAPEVELPPPQPEGAPPLELKMGFDGCGVTNGMTGTLFAAGLAAQCDVVVKRARQILSAHGAPLPLVINVLGLSRGGIAALLLAKALARLPRALAPRVELSLCLFDPVPGNGITSARWLDVLGLSTARSVMDVSHCSIARCLALYPHEPLPALAFHAPVLPRYPARCALVEDATLGCHQGALYPVGTVKQHAPELYPACALAAARICRFFAECGTRLHFGRELAPLDDAAALALCEREVRAAAAPTFRAAHSAGPAASIVRRAAAPLLNQMHRTLLAAADPADPRLRAEAGADGGLLLEVVHTGAQPQGGSGV